MDKILKESKTARSPRLCVSTCSPTMTAEPPGDDFRIIPTEPGEAKTHEDVRKANFILMGEGGPFLMAAGG